MNPLDDRINSTSLRALLALAVVLVMLATTGWTAVRPNKGPDDSRAAALTAWLHGSVSGRGLPDPAAGARTVASFFAGLTTAQGRRLADRYPLIVGNLNGAPPVVRYRANRTSLREARGVEEQRSHDHQLTPLGRREARVRVQRYASLLTGGRQILSFDPTGSGRVAEVLGDLATAARVSVVVPGVDTDVLTFERTTRPYSAPVGMAHALYDAERHTDPAAKTAVIAWADYTTPDGVGLDASTGELAANGAVRLNALLDALPSDSRVALFCHSYGSVLCGIASPGLPSGKVSDISVFGSPGMRVNNASQLDTTAHVWAARDADDWIGDVPHVEFAGLGHGADPVSDGFGARVVSTERAQGHPGYFAPGTGSLANFADIALGRYGSVHCADGHDGCSAGLS